MEDQLTIFDYMEPETNVKWHPVIDRLSADVHRLFSKCDIGKEQYAVWSHVPNLGKRYEAMVYVKDKADVMDIEFSKLIEKYEPEQLEVSISSAGCFKDGYSHSLMISSLWITKGHKEKPYD